MVNVEGKKIESLPIEISKTVKIGNDGRQFIIRIPIKISDNSILKSFKKKYSAEVKINRKENDKIIIELK
jgi:hypothetical protein